MINTARIRQGRPLSVIERTIAATTAAIAVATVMLALTHSAGATAPAGTLPLEGPVSYAPPSAISHIEFVPHSD